MSISRCFSKGQTVRAVLVCLCAILVVMIISVAAAKPGGFKNMPHQGGFNRGGNFGFGGMNFHQGGLKHGARHSFKPGTGSGHGGSSISVSPIFGGNKGGFTGSGGPKPSVGPGPSGPSGFGTGPCNNGGFAGSGGPKPSVGPGPSGPSGFCSGPGKNTGMGKGPSNNTPGCKPGFGGKPGFTGGGYCGNGFLMTKPGCDIKIKMPFGNGPKSTGCNGGAAFGCGDSFSKVFSGPEFKGCSLKKPGPVCPTGPKLNCSPCPKKCGPDKPGHGKWNCWKKPRCKKHCWKKKWRRRYKWRRRCKPCCPPHDNDDDADADFDCDMDIDFDCDTDLDMDTDTDIDLDCDIDMDTDIDLDCDIDLDTDDDVLVPAAPLWFRPEIEYSGCPALMNWVAAELGVPREQLQIYIVGSRTNVRDVNPCDMCARFQSAALTLHDRQGVMVSALTAVIDEIAEPGAPISPEQMMQIAQQLSDPVPGSIYEQAAKYLSAAEAYVTILTEELGFTTDGTFSQIAKYIGTIDDPETADYVTAQLINLGQ